MSLSSYYKMATALTPDEVFALLRDNLPFVTGEDESGKFRPTLFTTNEGLQIETYPEERPRGVEEAFGFRPTVRVSMDLARGGVRALTTGC